MISYYSNRGGLGGVSLVTVKGVETVSQLLIKDANEKDEVSLFIFQFWKDMLRNKLLFQGSYTCDPSCCPDATTRVFVLDGEWQFTCFLTLTLTPLWRTVFENHSKSLILQYYERFGENCSLQSNSVTRQVNRKLDKCWWKMPKWEN